MPHPLRWYLLPVLAAVFLLLVSATPATAGTGPAPLATPGQAVTLLVQVFPALGEWLGATSPSASPEPTVQGEPTGTVLDQDKADPDHLPPPDDAPSRDGGYGPWGDEASGPWPRS